MKRIFILLPLFVILMSGCRLRMAPEWGASNLFLGTQPAGHAVRISSWDQTGANNDSIQIAPGETAVLADIEGAGIIRHLWITTNADGPIGRTLVLRMYWDGSDTPAVEVPMGDFFGVGNGMDAELNSFPLTITSAGRARNSWWHMPFEHGAKITMTNEGAETHGAFYYHIDYLALDEAPPTSERFYAQYRQAYPAQSPDNLLILETTGKGRYMGTVMSVESTAPHWWGEGDELIEADDYEPIRGTGTEDYFCDAWGIHVHNTLWHGAPVSEGFDNPGLASSMYRFHIMDAIPFREKIKVSFEHGSGNDRKDNFSSVAYWYQEPPASPFPEFPPLVDRLTGEGRLTFIRKGAWRFSNMAMPEAREQLVRLRSYASTPESLTLIDGLTLYAAGLENPDDEVLEKVETVLDYLEDMVEDIPEEERYSPAKVDLPTDDDNPIPHPVVAAYRTLLRARHHLARKVALKRGLEPGDELVIEARDANGNVTPAPAYAETADFTNSYAKVDDVHLMGNGARFTYGNADPSWARFCPDFPVSGTYEVLVIFSYGANADDTRYKVKHADGESVVPLPQRGRMGTSGRNNRVWHSLGEYTFTEDQDPDKGCVELHTSPGITVPNPRFEYRAYADSVRFVYKGK